MFTRRNTLELAGVAFGALGPARRVLGQSPKRLRVVGFAGASNVPLWIGQERGLFAKEGVEPVFELTPNSVEMVRNLYEGRFDLAFRPSTTSSHMTRGRAKPGLPVTPILLPSSVSMTEC